MGYLSLAKELTNILVPVVTAVWAICNTLLSIIFPILSTSSQLCLSKQLLSCITNNLYVLVLQDIFGFRYNYGEDKENKRFIFQFDNCREARPGFVLVLGPSHSITFS